MRNRDAVLVADLSREAAERVSLLLLSMGIDNELVARGWSWAVVVDPGDLEQAARLLAEESPEREPERRSRRRSPTALGPEAPEHWFGRGSPAVLGLIALCVAIHLELHGLGSASRSRMLAFGAITDQLVDAGQYWRLVTAIFLHFNAGHLLSNMGTLLIVGPPLAHLVGSWRFLALFVATGTAANLASHLVYPLVGMKAGASGAIAGVLGALGGQALRPDRGASKLATWKVLGAMAAFYGMLIGFGPGRDNYAHMAGILAGIVMGRMVAPLPAEGEHRAIHPR